MSEEFDWNTIEPPDPIDPHDTLADPERHARVSTQVNERERQERNADGALSDFGHRAFAHQRGWDREED